MLGPQHQMPGPGRGGGEPGGAALSLCLCSQPVSAPSNPFLSAPLSLAWALTPGGLPRQAGCGVWSGVSAQQLCHVSPLVFTLRGLQRRCPRELKGRHQQGDGGLSVCNLCLLGSAPGEGSRLLLRGVWDQKRDPQAEGAPPLPRTSLALRRRPCMFPPAPTDSPSQHHPPLSFFLGP